MGRIQTWPSAFALAFSIALVPHVRALAQTGMGGMEPESLVVAVLGQRNDCRARYPTLATALDDGLEVMIQRNLNSYTRETWAKLSSINISNAPKLSQKQCEQLPSALAAWNWNPLVEDVHEMACQNAVRTLQFEQISVIGVSVEASTDGPRLEEVAAGGPASIADLRVGDVITEFGKIATPTACQLALAVARSSAGGKTEATFLRNGVRMQVSIIPATKIIAADDRLR